MRKPPPHAAAATAFLALTLTACGGGSSTSSSSGGGGAAADVTIGASGLTYTGAAYTAKSTDFTVKLDNQDPVEHNVTLRQGDKLLVEAGPKKSATAKVTLAPGSYDVYCTVPGHNMKATITVQ